MPLLALSRPIAFIATRDRGLTLPFYEDVLGLPLIGSDPFAANLDAGGLVLRLTTVKDHQPHPHTVFGWQVSDIDAVSRALIDKGVIFLRHEGAAQDDLGIWTAPDGGLRVNWFADPEGNVLSLVQG